VGVINMPSNGGSKADANGGTRQAPTPEEPLRGLTRLQRLAVFGRDRILQLAAEPVVYAWQDIVPIGTSILLAGPPGGGKTTLLFLLLAARARGVGSAPAWLLGREIYPAPAGQIIVLIEGEHGDASTARKLVHSLQLLGLDHSPLDRIYYIARKAVVLGSPEWLEIVEMIRAGLVSDIAIDTLARVAPGDANDEREQVATFETITAAIESAPSAATQPVTWAVGHTRKTDGELTGADVSGSTQRTGQPDGVLIITPKREDGQVVASRVKFEKLRDTPTNYPAAATLIVQGGQLLMQPSPTKPPPDASAKHEERAQVILAIIRAKPGCSREHIKEHSGIGSNNLDSTLKVLAEDGRVHVSKAVRGTSNQYRLAATEVSDDE
jgi:hypothetical protein